VLGALLEREIIAQSINTGFDVANIQFDLQVRKPYLKVLTNEKRGGLELAAFDRSPFKLFSLKFSNKSVQAPSCERHKTAPRTLFLSFAN
jgi:hypothetical protein